MLAADPGSPKRWREVWNSEVFADAMGPVAALSSLLIGHHKRKLTCLDASLAEVAALGGQTLTTPREMGDGRMAVIRDPAGAVAALFQSGSED